MLFHKSSVFILALTASTLSHAELEPLLTIGYEFGGDDLVTTTTTDLSAGGGIVFGAGASFSHADSSLSLRLMLHYMFNAVEFTSPNGEADTDVFPLELGAFNRFSRHELGAGLSAYLNPSYEICFDSGGCSNTKFDDATGVFVQYNYIFSQAKSTTMTTDTYIGFKLKAMDYETGNTKLDANSLGIYLGSKF